MAIYIIWSCVARLLWHYFMEGKLHQNFCTSAYILSFWVLVDRNPWAWHCLRCCLAALIHRSGRTWAVQTRLWSGLLQKQSSWTRWSMVSQNCHSPRWTRSRYDPFLDISIPFVEDSWAVSKFEIPKSKMLHKDPFSWFNWTWLSSIE